VLAQTVPDFAKTESLQEMELYLGALIRQVDSSLLEQWERIRNPEHQPAAAAAELRPPGAEEALADVTRDPKAFRSLIRNTIFQFLRALANGDHTDALACLGAGQKVWSALDLADAVAPFFLERSRIRLDPEARNLRHTYFDTDRSPTRWTVQQMLLDTEQCNDWVAEFLVDLPASKAASAPCLSLVRIGPLVETRA
jgi:hypothetical protein